MNNILYSGNCIDILHTLDNNSVDLIYLDPPFFSEQLHVRYAMYTKLIPIDF